MRLSRKGANAGGRVSCRFGRAGPTASLSSAVRLYELASMDSGKTVGTRGSEEGLIVSDEEHGGCTAPWSVTCGIYGSFLHTAFASSEAEGRAKYSDMKA